MDILYAVRHGESAANVLFAAGAGGGGGAVMGGGDAGVPLSERGVGQAEALRGWVGGAGVGVAVVSPYARARRTWEAMAGGCGVRAVVDERVRDRGMGVFELMTPQGIAVRAPEEAARRALLGEWYYRPPGGESLADVALRVRDFTRDVAVAAPGGRVLVVAHDAVVIALRYVYEGFGAPVPDPSVAVPNASVSRWDADGHGGMRLTAFGVTDPAAEGL